MPAEIAALGRLGCTYLQLDDTSLAYLNDPQQRRGAGRPGATTPSTSTCATSARSTPPWPAKPEGMAVTTHMCRGNYRSSWVAEGGYDFVAEALFNELDVDGFFLEYDDARSGGFEPLRFVPPGKVVVLGLVTTKRGELESADVLKRRIDEASRYMPVGAAVPVAAMRVCLDGGRQRPHLRRAGGQARACIVDGGTTRCGADLGRRRGWQGAAAGRAPIGPPPGQHVEAVGQEGVVDGERRQQPDDVAPRPAGQHDDALGVAGRPRSAAAAAGSGTVVPGCTISMACMAPRPRTSPMAGRSACRARRRSTITDPIRSARPARSRCAMRSMAARAAAHATGFPP